MIKDKDKTKDQLIAELVELHQRIAELEKLENQLKLASERLWESEKRFRELADLLPQVVYEIDRFTLNDCGEFSWDEIEVVGNIYKNPGLLKEK